MLTQDEDPILGCNAVSVGKWFLMFWRNALPSSWSDMKIKTNAGAGQEGDIYRYSVTGLWVVASVCRPTRDLWVGSSK